MKIVSIVGARPQFIKLAPLCQALRDVRSAHHVIVHSGQHYDYRMSKVFFDLLGIPKPDYNLAVGSGSHAYQTARILDGLEKVLLKERPDWVILFGDTNTTLAGALAASQLHLRIAHVEAGLRSFNRLMPEETNRIVTDHCSDLLLCPTRTALHQLKKEGFASRKHGSTPWAVNVGDIMHDVLLLGLKVAGSPERVYRRLGVAAGAYFLATVHRGENTDSPGALKNILSGLVRISHHIPVVLPIHPRTHKAIRRHSLSSLAASLKIIQPVSYTEMLLLQRGSRKILTDSGGIQKEAYLLKIPCVTLRAETEWPETVSSGWNTLVGANTGAIEAAAFGRPKSRSHPAYFGDGKTAYRILRLLRDI